MQQTDLEKSKEKYEIIPRGETKLLEYLLLY